MTIHVAAAYRHEQSAFLYRSGVITDGVYGYCGKSRA